MTSDASLGVYRAMLRLYPRSFRAEYGEDMVQLMHDQLRDESAPRVWTRTALDLVISIPTRHVEGHMSRPSPMLVPLVFACLGLAALASAVVVGSSFGVVAFLAVLAGAFASVAYAAARFAHVIRDRAALTGCWWQVFGLGAAILASDVVVANAVGDFPGHWWYAFIGVLFLSFVMIAAGAVLGLGHLAGRSARRVHA